MYRQLKILTITIALGFVPAGVYAAFPYAMTFVVSAGDTILADHYNTANNEHINNNIPESIDDYSNSVAEMGSVTDPFPAGTESQATTLDGELQRLRKKIFDLVSATNGTATKWYHDLSVDITAHTHSGTSTGGNVLTAPTISDFTNATHTHSGTNTAGSVLGAIEVTDITVTGSAASTPDANTLTKDHMVGARCVINGTGTPAYTFEINFTTINDNSTGNYTLGIDRDFADTNYSSIGSSDGNELVNFSSVAVGSIIVTVISDSGGAHDPDRLSVVLIGAQ